MPEEHGIYPTWERKTNGLGLLIFILFIDILFTIIILRILFSPVDDSIDHPFIYKAVGVFLVLLIPGMISYIYFIPLLYNPAPDIYEKGILLSPDHHSTDLIANRRFIQFRDVEEIIVNPSEEYLLKLAQKQTEEFYEREEQGKIFTKRMMKQLRAWDPTFYYHAMPLIENEPERSVEEVMEERMEWIKGWIHIIMKDGAVIRIDKDRIIDINRFVSELNKLNVKVEY